MIIVIKHKTFGRFVFAKALPSGELELLVGVVDYRTKLVRPRVGVCTQLLSALQSGAHAPSSIPSPSTVIASHVLSAYPVPVLEFFLASRSICDVFYSYEYLVHSN